MASKPVGSGPGKVFDDGDGGGNDAFGGHSNRRTARRASLPFKSSTPSWSRPRKTSEGFMA